MAGIDRLSHLPIVEMPKAAIIRQVLEEAHYLMPWHPCCHPHLLTLPSLPFLLSRTSRPRLGDNLSYCDRNLFTQECFNAPTEAVTKGEVGWKLSYREAVPMCSLQRGRWSHLLCRRPGRRAVWGSCILREHPAAFPINGVREMATWTFRLLHEKDDRN